PAAWRVVLALAATYVEFLLFAQFGFLDQLQAGLGETAAVQQAMAWMGGAGLAASLAAGVAAGRFGAVRLLRPALLATAAVAAVSPLVAGGIALRLAAAAVGATTGVLTVALAAALRDLAPAGRVGRIAGLATGIAYAISNLPPLFAASPAVRALVPAALCLAAAVVIPRPAARLEGEGDCDDGDGGHGGDGGLRRLARPAGFAVVLGGFLVLIGLDAAAFAHVQASPALRAVTWEGPARQLLQGGFHLAAALLAGVLLDRRRLASLLVAPAVLFAVAFRLLAAGGWAAAAFAGPLYAAGISIYSTALVAYPSLAGEAPGLVPRRWRAALLFGVAGWLGSALGVGMAQDLARLPVLPAAVAAAVFCVVALAVGRRRLVPLYGPAAAVALVVSLPHLAGPAAAGSLPSASPRGAEAVARGRAVYVAEGCIHCHSQYVRPRAEHDVRWWGPARPLDRRERPPLVGVRRLGPDLANAGNRRSAAWHALHLAAPRRLVPGSRMPSYAHLVAGGGGRGEDLAAYLASLGAGSERPPALVRRPPGPPSPARGAHLFAAWCSPCHGSGGRGDGPLAAAVHRPAMDLGKGRPWAISWGPGQEPLEVGVARVVRNGIPGTSMPGHEFLTEQQVADLAAHVARLIRRASAAAPEERP
ncbi:MAG TPA: cbb3-type cytochrome c oxidase subunit II, partial [Thermoanaerobaculia bacterium]